MVYDKIESRLVVFGGWNNNWLSDLHTLSVSKIVGPPYAVDSCEPALGPLTGKTKITIYGIGFQDTSQINVKFVCAKSVMPVNGTYVN